MIINKDLNLANSNIESLGELEEVKGNLSLCQSKNLEDLRELEYVGENLDLEYCQNLKSKIIDKWDYELLKKGKK